MKNLLILITLGLGSFILHADTYSKVPKKRAAASIEIYNNAYRPVRVELNGHLIHEGSRGSYGITHLAPGRHQLTIFELRRGHHRPRIIYRRYLRLRPGHEAIVRISRRGHVKVSVRKAIYCSSCGKFSYGSHACSIIYNTGDMNSHPAMRPSTFRIIKTSMQRTSFESARKIMMRQALQGQYISSYQLRQLLFLFDFESSRLEMARLAYPHLIDPQNIALIYDVFEYESSIKHLNAYLDSRY